MSAWTLAETLDCCQRILVRSPVAVSIDGAEPSCDDDTTDDPVDPDVNDGAIRLGLAVATPGTGTHW
jgi:hypothetical protein